MNESPGVNLNHDAVQQASVMQVQKEFIIFSVFARCFLHANVRQYVRKMRSQPRREHVQGSYRINPSLFLSVDSYPLTCSGYLESAVCVVRESSSFISTLPCVDLHSSLIFGMLSPVHSSHGCYRDMVAVVKRDKSRESNPNVHD